MSESDSNRTDDIAQRILEAASKLLVHYGYDKTTMNDIARKAGVAKSTIYVRWNKKEDLIGTLLWRETRRYTLDWFQRIENDPEGGTYANFMRLALEAFMNNEFLVAIYRNDRQMLGSMVREIGLAQAFVQRMQFFESFFKAMQAAGVVRQDVDGHTLTYLMNILHFGIIQIGEMLPDEHVPPMDEVLGMMVEVIDRMVSPEDGGDSAAGKGVIRQYQQHILAMLDKFEETL